MVATLVRQHDVRAQECESDDFGAPIGALAARRCARNAALQTMQIEIADLGARGVAEQLEICANRWRPAG